jgi:hypothetical protein
MKTSLTTPSHFRCTVARIFGDERHAASCPDCGAQVAADAAFDAALRHEAAGSHASIDPRLNDRVIDALRAANQERRPARSYTGILSFSGAAVAVLAAAFVFRLSTPSTPAEADALAGDVTLLVTEAGTLSKRVWQAVEPSAVALADYSPLQDEIESVYSDAQSALSFLAINFLPSPVEPANQATERRG